MIATTPRRIDRHRPHTPSAHRPEEEEVDTTADLSDEEEEDEDEEESFFTPEKSRGGRSSFGGSNSSSHQPSHLAIFTPFSPSPARKKKRSRPASLGSLLPPPPLPSLLMMMPPPPPKTAKKNHQPSSNESAAVVGGAGTIKPPPPPRTRQQYRHSTGSYGVPFPPSHHQGQQQHPTNMIKAKGEGVGPQRLHKSCTMYGEGKSGFPFFNHSTCDLNTTSTTTSTTTANTSTSEEEEGEEEEGQEMEEWPDLHAAPAGPAAGRGSVLDKEWPDLHAAGGGSSSFNEKAQQQCENHQWLEEEMEGLELIGGRRRRRKSSSGRAGEEEEEDWTPRRPASQMYGSIFAPIHPNESMMEESPTLIEEGEEAEEYYYQQQMMNPSSARDYFESSAEDEAAFVPLPPLSSAPASDLLLWNRNPFLPTPPCQQQQHPASSSFSSFRSSPTAVNITSAASTNDGSSQGSGWKLSRYAMEFEELGILGEGRYSVVKGCFNRMDGCPYAVKRLAHRFRNEADRSHCLREAFAWSSLADCPKLVRYYDAWIDEKPTPLPSSAAAAAADREVKTCGRREGGGYLYIQMELCLDGSLEDLVFGDQGRREQQIAHLSSTAARHGVHLSQAPTTTNSSNPSCSPSPSSCSASSSKKVSRKSKSLIDQQQQGGLSSSCSPLSARREGEGWEGSEMELLSVLKDASLALHHMHRRGIAHMDIKPSNILLAGDGSYKLGDLGHAMLIDGSMSLVEEGGDQRYMAREVLAHASSPQFKGKHLIAADIFSLGASMYEVASKIRLKGSGPEWHVLREGPVPKVQGLSPRLQALLTNMMDPDPFRRPPAVTVLLTSIVHLAQATGRPLLALGEGGQQQGQQQQQQQNRNESPSSSSPFSSFSSPSLLLSTSPYSAAAVAAAVAAVQQQQEREKQQQGEGNGGERGRQRQ